MKQETLIYICYGKEGLKGHLNGNNVTEVRKKIKEYNKQNKDKIVKFVDPFKCKKYEVRG